jgi:hypothetical protein
VAAVFLHPDHGTRMRAHREFADQRPSRRRTRQIAGVGQSLPYEEAVFLFGGKPLPPHHGITEADNPNPLQFVAVSGTIDCLMLRMF